MPDASQLIEEARAGVVPSRETLYARHLGRLRAFVASSMSARSRRIATADDVVQEVYLESIRKLDDFEYRGPTSFYRWLVSIAEFKMREIHRAAGAAKRAPAEPLEPEPGSKEPTPSDRAARNERLDRLVSALDAMEGDRARAVRMRYLEGRTISETAKALEKSEAAVKALVSRGLADLSARLAE